MFLDSGNLHVQLLDPLTSLINKGTLSAKTRTTESTHMAHRKPPLGTHLSANKTENERR